VIAFAVVIVTWVVWRMGRLDFWKAAASMPDEAYDWFMSDDCWVVQDPTLGTTGKPDPKSAYTGPFSIWIPKLGDRRVVVYGLRDQIEASQQRFLEQHGLPARPPKLPPPSAIGLFYPLAAVIYFSQTTPAQLIDTIGYGFAQVGYMLLVAGLVAGTFRAFRLTRRWQVLLAGALAVAIGAVLSNATV
jgi:hypothetical protein